MYLKCENLQRAGSFKIRGAYTRIARLTAEERAARRGRGERRATTRRAWRWPAQLLGIQAKVYMPLGRAAAEGAGDPGVRRRGRVRRTARVDECLVARPGAGPSETGAVLIHPFDHPDIVAGQGTVGLEILEQCPDVATVAGLHRRRRACSPASPPRCAALRPDVRVIGVQAEGAAAYPASLSRGRPGARSAR